MKLTIKVSKMEKSIIQGEREERWAIGESEIGLEFEARETGAALDMCLEAFRTELSHTESVSMIHPVKGNYTRNRDTLDQSFKIYEYTADPMGIAEIRFNVNNITYSILTDCSVKRFENIFKLVDETARREAIDKVLPNMSISVLIHGSSIKITGDCIYDIFKEVATIIATKGYEVFKVNKE